LLPGTLSGSHDRDEESIGKEAVKAQARNSSTGRPKLTFVVTVPESASFFRGQLAFFVANGFAVEVVTSPGPQLDEAREQGATAYEVPMCREMKPWSDIVSLWRLWRLFRRTQPDLVVAGTPKAGLLGTVTARLAGVPRVIYRLHGLRLETAPGWKRRVLWLTEWVACHAAGQVLCVSPSLRERAIALGLVEAERCSVAGKGTSNGIDTAHWRRTPEAEATGRRTRAALGIPETAPVVGFVGRLVRDKGIVELYEAFTRLLPSFPELRLLLVGRFEDGDPIPAELRARMERDPAVRMAGFAVDVAPYYWAMDVLALPTYREGFPGVPLEAQAASVPAVCTDATGAVDALVDGVTGLRVAVGDAAALESALRRLLGDAELRRHMGQAGPGWVQENFERDVVWKHLLACYRSFLQEAPKQTRALRAAAIDESR